MSVPDVASFTAADVDLLVGFLDGIHLEFGAEARRDGIISIQVREVSQTTAVALQQVQEKKYRIHESGTWHARVIQHLIYRGLWAPPPVPNSHEVTSRNTGYRR